MLRMRDEVIACITSIFQTVPAKWQKNGRHRDGANDCLGIVFLRVENVPFRNTAWQ